MCCILAVLFMRAVLCDLGGEQQIYQLREEVAQAIQAAVHGLCLLVGLQLSTFIIMPVCFYNFATYKLFTTVLSEFYIDYIHLQSADNGDWGGTRTHIIKRTVSPNTARDYKEKNPLYHSHGQTALSKLKSDKIFHLSG